jgi:programmed cell death protein 5
MDLEQLRKKRSEELQQMIAKQKEEEEKAKAIEQQLEMVLRQVLSQEAKNRLANVKMVNKELYFLASRQLIQLFNRGELQGKVSEGELKKLLARLSSLTKKEIKIKRK